MISDRIKQLREYRNYTQNTLARELGVTRACINAWETGTSNPSIKYLISLANLLNVTTDSILERDNRINVDITDLDNDEKSIILGLLSYFDKKR